MNDKTRDVGETELKPCPFCGGRACLVEPVYDLLPYVECLRCSCKMPMKTNSEEAVAAWNRRPTPQDSGRDEVIEAAAAIADGWLELFGDRDITGISARSYARDAVKDIAEGIRALKSKPSPSSGDGTGSPSAPHPARAASAARECWDRINSLIVKGPLPGNGTDKSAERNGLVRAANIIHSLAFPPKPEGVESAGEPLRSDEVASQLPTALKE